MDANGHQVSLKVVEKEKTKLLLDRMEDAGCVFNFIVLSPSVDELIGEKVHRRALMKLHEKLMKEAWDWYNDLIKNPDYKGGGGGGGG
ncbi:hypothetical protein HNQ83_30990, partial [Pseudomonas sp. C2B4]|nr:hypothetical protein [Pseudomonas sp. C2B4]